MRLILFVISLFLCVWSSKGQNNALNFDGVNDFVSIADNSQIEFGPTEDFSIEFWAKIPSSNQGTPNGETYNAIIDKSGITGGFPYSIRYHNHLSADNGKIQAVRYDGTNTSSVMSTGTFNDDAWHHIAFVKNGASLLLYIDGVLQATETDLSTGTTTNSAALYLGRSGNPVVPRRWNGTMDQLRIWNDARTAQEVADNMEQELTGSETGMVALYHFNYGIPGGSNSGQTTVEDATANANDGTLNNFALTGDNSNFVSSNGTTMEGNVGVGTDQPQARMHLKGNSWTALTIETGSNDALIQLTDDGSDINNDWTIRMDESNGDALQIRNNLVDVMSLSTTGSVGIGTVTPGSKLDVLLDASGSAISGTTSFNTGTGILGSATSATGTTYGVRGTTASSGGYGIHGDATSLTGTTYGVYGKSDSDNGRGVQGVGYIGVYGISESTAGRALYGVAGATTGLTYGVYGFASSNQGRGVAGIATAATGTTYGVYGQSASTSGYGFYGNSTPTTGTTFGGAGRSASNAGCGLFGEATSTTGTTRGIYGKSVSTSGVGVFGETTAATGGTYGVHGKTASTSGVGVFGESVSTGTDSYGVFGSANGGGVGVRGENLATTGSTRGVYGRIVSPSGTAVHGEADVYSGFGTGVIGETNSGDGYGVRGINHASGIGIYGQAGSNVNFDGIGVLGVSLNYGQIGTGSYGVKGITSGYYDNGAGVYGVAEHDGNGISYGILGTAASLEGRGVKGIASSATGTTYGIFGETASTGGRGVYGVASAATGTTHGVLGIANSENGRGVAGESSGEDGKALYGYATGLYGKGIQVTTTSSHSSANAILANASGGGNSYAGYFIGKVHVAGALSKSSGSFKIDHPLDPENKYLYHSFVESPDMMNIYNGNITTDGSGLAEVTLPTYFEVLNMEYRYQLTVIGEFAQAIISQEIEGNRFSIRTDKPHIKVSWQVTGIRQDPYAKTHRIVPEVAKESENVGKYLIPEVYGRPATSAINYVEPLKAEQEE